MLRFIEANAVAPPCSPLCGRQAALFMATPPSSHCISAPQWLLPPGEEMTNATGVLEQEPPAWFEASKGLRADAVSFVVAAWMPETVSGRHVQDVVGRPRGCAQHCCRALAPCCIE